MIRQDFIDRLRASADIVTLIQELIPLTKAGAQYKACCPFHNEKSPSFIVSPARQTYKCFGCGKTGDVIRFVEEYKRLTFIEAVTYVAGRLNQVVEYEHRPESTPNRFKNFEL